MSSAVLVHPSSLQCFVLGFSSLLEGRKNIFSLNSLPSIQAFNVRNSLWWFTDPNFSIHPILYDCVGSQTAVVFNSCLIFNFTSNVTINQIDLLSFCLGEMKTFPADVLRPHYFYWAWQTRGSGFDQVGCWIFLKRGLSPVHFFNFSECP